MQLLKIAIIFMSIVVCSIVMLGNEPPPHTDHGKVLAIAFTGSKSWGIGMGIGDMDCETTKTYYILYEDGCIISSKDGKEIEFI